MAWSTKNLTLATAAEEAAALDSADARGYVTAMVTVTEAQYVPSNVFVRTRRSPLKFEGILRASALDQLRADKKVADVSHTRGQEFGW